MKSFGRTINEHRVKLDISQRELAKLVGCGRTSILRFEVYGEIPPLHWARRIAQLLNFSLDQDFSYFQEEYGEKIRGGGKRANERELRLARASDPVQKEINRKLAQLPFPRMLRARRSELNLTSHALAKRLGLCRQTLSGFEYGHRVPTAKSMECLARELNFDIKEWDRARLKDQIKMVEYNQLDLEEIVLEAPNRLKSKWDDLVLPQPKKNETIALVKGIT